MKASTRSWGRNSFCLALLAGCMAGTYLVSSGPGWSRQRTLPNVAWIGAIALGVLALWELAGRLVAHRCRCDLTAVRYDSAFPWLLGGIILAGFAPIYWFASGHPAIAPYVRWYVLAVACLAVLALNLVTFSTRRAAWQRVMERYDKALLAILLLGYVAAGIALGVYRWRIFTLGNVDSAIVIQSLRYTLDEGRLFFNTLEKASHLGVHNSPIYFLLLPLYALCRVPEAFLVVLPPLAIGLSAIPFFALARAKIGAGPALFLSAAYLLAPYIMARTVGNLYEMTLLPCVWLPAFYYYDRKRLGPFLLFALLSLAVKESIAATVLVYTVYSLVKRRSLAWVVAPAVLSILSLILSYTIVLPGLGGNAISSRTAAILGPLGETPRDVLRYAIGKPRIFLRMIFNMPKLALLYQLFQPLLFLIPLLSGEIIFALPALGLNLLAQAGSVGIRAWESAIFGPVLFIAAIYGIRWVARHLPILTDRQAKATTRMLLLAIGVFFATLACAPYWLRTDEYLPKPYLAAQQEAVALIPPEVSISAPDYMVARFAERRHLQLQTGQPFWAEYHIVDMNWVASVRGHRMPEETAQEYAVLVAQAQGGRAHGGLQLVWTQDDIYVLRHGER